ncbi:MAG: leucyl aminopeptidase [Clostridiales bacterium]|nr:leucyl aminopeptidase [Clostridiales bacterium]
MKFTVTAEKKEGKETKVFFAFEGEGEKTLGFCGEFLQTLFVIKEEQPIIYVGLGKKGVENLADTSKQMELFATVCATCKKQEITAAHINITPLLGQIEEEKLAQNAALGLSLGAYEYKKDEAYDFAFEGFSPLVESALEKGRILGEAVIEARRLTDCPSNQLKPLDFATRLKNWVTPLGVECKIIEEAQLEQMGMGGLLAVGKSAGTNAPPCLCVLQYQREKSLPHTGLVGKGVTFDSGGTSLKPSASMDAMKGDMAGGAAVAATIYALAATKTPANVTAVIPMCENRLAHDSLLPGDVYRSFSGKTVEVLNTDAEGRLILADAVSYAISEEKCDRIIDIATLTGAVVGALGQTVAGVITNNESFWKTFRVASVEAGEQYWRFPAYEEHKKMIKSEFADLKNLGEKYCGTITGGLFIGEFAEQTPWIHLDIAGTANVDRAYKAYQSKGATGAGVTSMYGLLAKEGLNK